MLFPLEQEKMNEYLQAFSKLEFDAVKSHVATYVHSSLAVSLLKQTTPFASLRDIRYELDLVSEMKQVIVSEGEINIRFSDNCPLYLSKLSIDGAYLFAGELREIFELLNISRVSEQFFAKREKVYILLGQKSSQLFTNKILEFNIEQAIDENGNVRDNATKVLRDIRRRIAEHSNQLRKKLETLLKKCIEDGVAQDEIITTREGRMVIPIKAEYKNSVDGFIHSSSSSGLTVFIEPSETLQLNNEIRSLHFEEYREVEKILRDLSKQIAEHRDSLQRNVEILAQLEVLQAKAKYSREIHGTSIHVREEGSILLEDAYHPLLFNKHKRSELVPLTIEIGNGWNTLLITGPNAGGKTVALKTIGLLQTMIQAGFHIPASSNSHCRIIKKLFVDIGDEQSIENDLSTFSSHLNNLKTIIEHADNESLILLDELGSGTDPSEGSAIAASVLEHLTAMHSFTIATTHNGELKAFAQNTNGIENAGMEFDQRTLMPTYRLCVGIPGSSYALEIAQRLDFPNFILQQAKKYRGEIPNYLENLLNEVENRSQLLKSELESLRLERNTLHNTIQEYKTKQDSLQRELKEIRRKAIDDANEIILSARKTIEQAVREIKETAADKHILKKQFDAVEQVKNDFRQSLQELIDPSTEPSALFRIGDSVKMKNGNELGKIVSKTNAENEYVVSFSSVKMKAKGSDLQLVKESEQQKKKNLPSSFLPREYKREIDLRGLYGDEAIVVVDKFLDESKVAGMERVHLIHGKGTGALRKRITEFLSTHPLVQNFQIAEWNEGGTGVTVVELG